MLHLRSELVIPRIAGGLIRDRRTTMKTYLIGIVGVVVALSASSLMFAATLA